MIDFLLAGLIVGAIAGWGAREVVAIYQKVDPGVLPDYDDLDMFILEEMRDPEFFNAYRRAQFLAQNDQDSWADEGTQSPA